MEDDLLVKIAEGVGRTEGKVDGINVRLDTLNGRIGRLEDWRHEMERAAARVAGIQEGNADVLVSKKTATKLWAFAGVMATGTGTGAAWLWRHLS